MPSLSAAPRMSPKMPENSSARANLRKLSVALLCAYGLAAPTAATAAPGDLDPSFGTGGMVTTDLGGVSQATGAAVQPDGKVVAAGFAESATTRLGSFVVARYTEAGALDPTFGTGGRTVTAIGKDGRAFAMALQADSRIVAAGFTQANNGKKSFVLARYRTDGHLDTTFGSGGKALTKWGGGGGEAHAVALAPDGKIVVAGWSVATGSEQFALARYKSNGRIDTSFGKAGLVSSILGKTSAINGVVVQSDGKIVAAGYASAVGNIFHIAVARYLVNGTPDPSFGTGGVVTTSLSRGDIAWGVALQPDGKIVAAGRTGNQGAFFGVVRYDANGHPDPSFGSGGVVTTAIGSGAVPFAVAIGPGGDILAAGFSDPVGGFTERFTLVSYLPNGTPDPSFGTGGVVTTDFGSYTEAHAVAFVGGTTPKIIAVGSAGVDGNGGKLALARYFDN